MIRFNSFPNLTENPSSVVLPFRNPPGYACVVIEFQLLLTLTLDMGE